MQKGRVPFNASHSARSAKQGLQFIFRLTFTLFWCWDTHQPNGPIDRDLSPETRGKTPESCAHVV